MRNALSSGATAIRRCSTVGQKSAEIRLFLVRDDGRGSKPRFRERFSAVTTSWMLAARAYGHVGLGAGLFVWCGG